MSTDADWSRFTVRINLANVTADQLYRAWATRSGIEEWFLRTSLLHFSYLFDLDYLVIQLYCCC